MEIPFSPCELISEVSVYIQCRRLCYTQHMYTVVLPLSKSSDVSPGLVSLKTSYYRSCNYMAFPQCVFEDESWAESLWQIVFCKHYNWIWWYYEVFCDYLMIFSIQFCRIDRTLQSSLKNMEIKKKYYLKFFLTCRFLWTNFSCAFLAFVTCQLSLVGQKRFPDGSLEITHCKVW